MSIIRRHTYSENKIKSICNDGYYVWIAYQGEDGESKLKKVEAFNPDIIYYDITIDSNDINKIIVDTTNSYIYLALNDDIYCGAIFSTSNPLGNYSYIDIPAGINEAPIDVTFDSTYWYLLTPGIEPNYTKIIVMNGETYTQTIELG